MTRTIKILAVLFLFLFILNACSTYPRGSSRQKIQIPHGENLLPAELTLPNKSNSAEKVAIPAVILVHGGAWRSRAGDLNKVSKKLLKAGFATMTIDYRLAPEHLYPAALIDIRNAVHWLTDNANRFNIDANRIAGWGYSAGAHLILLAGLDGKSNLRAIVAGGTPADLTAWPKSPLVTAFLGKSYAQAPNLWKQASPTFQVTKHAPPVYLYHGANDSLVEPEQMQKMKEALEAKSVPVETYLASLFGHYTTYIFSAKAERKGIDFLKRKLQ